MTVGGRPYGAVAECRKRIVAAPSRNQAGGSLICFRCFTNYGGADLLAPERRTAAALSSITDPERFLPFSPATPGRRREDFT